MTDNEPSFAELYTLDTDTPWEDATGQFKPLPILRASNEVWDTNKYIQAMGIALKEHKDSILKTMEERKCMDYVIDNGREIIINNWLFPKQEPIFIAPYDSLKIKPKEAVAHLDKAARLWIDKQYETNFKEHIGNNYKLRKKATKDTIKVAVPDAAIDYMIKSAHHRSTEFQGALKYAKDELAGHLVYASIGGLAGSIYHLSENAAIRLMIKKYIDALTALKEGKTESIFVVEGERLRQNISGALNTLRKTSKQPKSINTQYKLLNLTPKDGVSEVVEQEYNTFNSYYNNDSSPSPRNTVEIVRMVCKEKPVEKIVDLSVMYPELSVSLRQMVAHFSDYFRRGTEAQGDPNYIQLNNFNSIYASFHAIKNRLIFSGFTEEKAVAYIIEHGFNNRKLNYRNDLYKADYVFHASRCQMTNELMPAIFLTRVLTLKREVLNVSQYYLQFVANSIIRRYNYDAVTIGDKKELMWYEISLSAGDYYKQTLLSHNYNVMTHLSPRYLPHENIEVFSSGKVYEETPFLGIEIEVERQEKCQEAITEDVYDTIGRDFVIIKHDGSLQGHRPFEIVSAPATLAYHKDAWTKFMNATAIKSQLMSYTTGRCGMHVHISKGAFTGLHLAKFMQFINKVDNRNFITRLAGRDQGQYNVFTDYVQRSGKMMAKNQKTEGISYASKLIHGGNNGHYDAVSTSSRHNTVEVRIFRGNLATSHFYKNIEFVHAVWAYTKSCSMQQLDYKDFILWLFKENSKLYNNLQAWLMASGFAVSNRNTDNKATKEDIKKVQLVVSRKFHTKDKFIMKSGKDKGITKEELLANC